MPSQTYRNMREGQRRHFRNKFLSLLGWRGVLIVCIYGLLQSCQHFGRDSINEFTVFQLDYNSRILGVLIESAIIFFLAGVFRGSIRLSSSLDSIINKALWLTWVLIRLCLVFYALTSTLPMFWSVLRQAPFLLYTQWWTSKDQPWFTAESKFNSFIFWIITAIVYAIILVAAGCLFCVLYAIMLILSCCKIKNLDFTFFFGNALMLFVSAMTWYVYPYLFARPFRQSVIARIFNLNLPDHRRRNLDVRKEDLEKKEENLHQDLELHKTSFKSLMFDETKDCPVCLLEFTDDDNIVPLKCSQFHLYHLECLEMILKYSKKCALCRKEIKY